MSEIIERINQADSIIVYGTKKNGQDAFVGLHFLCPEKIVGFAVTRVLGEDNDVFGFPIRPIEEYTYLTDKNPLVIVSTRAVFYSEIVETVSGFGFRDYCVYGDGNENQVALHRAVEEKEKKPFAILKNEYKISELNKISTVILKDD